MSAFESLKRKMSYRCLVRAQSARRHFSSFLLSCLHPPIRESKQRGPDLPHPQTASSSLCPGSSGASYLERPPRELFWGCLSRLGQLLSMLRSSGSTQTSSPREPPAPEEDTQFSCSYIHPESIIHWKQIRLTAAREDQQDNVERWDLLPPLDSVFSASLRIWEKLLEGGGHFCLHKQCEAWRALHLLSLEPQTRSARTLKRVKNKPETFEGRRRNLILLLVLGSIESLRGLLMSSYAVLCPAPRATLKIGLI